MNEGLIQKFFKKNEIKKYDFSKLHFIYLKKSKRDNSDIQDQKLVNYKWFVFQIIYLIWSKWANLVNKLFRNNQNFEKNFMLTLAATFKKIGYLKNNTLDLGGGCGSYRGFWKESIGKIYLNHDPQIGNFEFIKLDDKSVYMVEGRAETLPYKNNVFDTILIADAIDHFSDPLKALNESNRVLEKRGKIIIFQCSHLHLGEKINYISRLIQKLKEAINHKIHINSMTNKDIKSVLVEAGYQKIKFYKRKVRNNPINLMIYIAVK